MFFQAESHTDVLILKLDFLILLNWTPGGKYSWENHLSLKLQPRSFSLYSLFPRYKGNLFIFLLLI